MKRSSLLASLSAALLINLACASEPPLRHDPEASASFIVPLAWGVHWEHVNHRISRLAVRLHPHVAFTVTACHFPGLCQATGAAALAPLFCEADEAYFGAVEPDVVLERPTTIARGGATCPFALRFRRPDF